jgi:hypothetical protein
VPPGGRLTESAADQLDKPGHRKGFLKERENSERPGALGNPGIEPPGDQYGREKEFLAMEFRDYVKPIQPGHVLIDDQALRVAASAILEERCSRAVGQDIEAIGFEQNAQRVADPIVVIDDANRSSRVDLFGFCQLGRRPKVSRRRTT